jgi:hypothetical protein
VIKLPIKNSSQALSVFKIFKFTFLCASFTIIFTVNLTVVIIPLKIGQPPMWDVSLVQKTRIL